MITNLTQEWEEQKRITKWNKLKEEFYLRLSLGLNEEDSQMILFANFFDSDGKRKSYLK